MSLDETLDSLIVTARPSCPVQQLMDSLPEETNTRLQAVFASSVSTSKIHAALGMEGYAIGRDTIGNHRHGRCRCFSQKKDSGK